MIKKTSLILLFVILSLNSFAQLDLYSILAKAEQEYKNGNFKKALRKLQLVENKSFRSKGFCGNALLDYDRLRNLLKVKIFIKQNEYDKARIVLNSMIYELPNDNLDSLKVITYQLQFGSDSLSKMFDFSLKSATIECVNKFNCFVLLPLSNGTQMKFKIPTSYNLILGRKNDEESKLNLWIEKFHNTISLNLIKNNKNSKANN